MLKILDTFVTLNQYVIKFLNKMKDYTDDNEIEFYYKLSDSLFPREEELNWLPEDCDWGCIHLIQRNFKDGMDLMITYPRYVIDDNSFTTYDENIITFFGSS